jgi:hypothetical protein
MNKWEYEIATVLIEVSIDKENPKLEPNKVIDVYCGDKKYPAIFNMLNELGKNGWELISISPFEIPHDTYTYLYNSSYYFKRPIEE